MQLIRGFLLFLLASSFLYGKERANIALIYDGPMQHEEAFSQQVQEEIIALLEDERELHFFIVENSWSLEGNANNLTEALLDDNVDLIITMGVLSSYELLKKTALSKPAVIGYNLNIFSAQSTPFPIQESRIVN